MLGWQAELTLADLPWLLHHPWGGYMLPCGSLLLAEWNGLLLMPLFLQCTVSSPRPAVYPIQL